MNDKITSGIKSTQIKKQVDLSWGWGCCCPDRAPLLLLRPGHCPRATPPPVFPPAALLPPLSVSPSLPICQDLCLSLLAPSPVLLLRCLV